MTADQDPILRRDGREISLLVVDEALSLTYVVRPGDERVTNPHVHRHTEAFYILEGELVFEVGAEGETVVVGAGGFVAAPPGVAHSFRTGPGRPARFVIVHAGDGGFASVMRGLRDGADVEWDIVPVPGDGGLPANRAIVSLPTELARTAPDRRCRRSEPRREPECPRARRGDRATQRS
jgi:quercetin dioxygenase-like cupin family protein